MQGEDCPCTHHDGPHWLMMDWYDHARSLEFLRQILACLEAGDMRGVEQNFAALTSCEKQRLSQKVWHMEHDPLKRQVFPYTLLGSPKYTDLNEEEREVWRKIKAILARLEQKRKEQAA